MIDNFISFSDQEIPIEGRGHTRPLHISVMLGDAILGPSSTVVKAFDGARRDVSQLSDAPYVEADSEALEASFRALEIANASSIEKGHPMLNPLPFNASIMMAKFMLRKGFQPGKGLGKYGQGVKNTLVLPSIVVELG
ncbi:hypothetical protein Lal_00010742 [Lupinus albus]|nr:hypothetical protein Lal_00010742 [Lupinus albus]